MHEYARSLIAHEGEFNLGVFRFLAASFLLLAVLLFLADLLEFRPRWQRYHPYRWPKLLISLYFIAGNLAYLLYLDERGKTVPLSSFGVYLALVFFVGVGLHTKLGWRELKSQGSEAPEGDDLFPWVRRCKPDWPRKA